MPQSAGQSSLKRLSEHELKDVRGNLISATEPQYPRTKSHSHVRNKSVAVREGVDAFHILNLVRTRRTFLAASHDLFRWQDRLQRIYYIRWRNF